MSKSRRPNNDGSISKHTRGYKGYISHEGKRKYVYGKTKEIVAQKLANEKSDKAIGKDITSTLKLSSFLTQFLKRRKQSVKPSTFEVYDRMIRHYLTPRLGGFKITTLDGELIADTWSAMSDDGHSPSVIQHCHATLSTALNTAIPKYIKSNPCEAVARMKGVPKVVKKEIMALSTDEQVSILKEAKETTLLYPIIYTALITGMRRGELVGLQWRDIDFENATIRVSRGAYQYKGETILSTPKTKSSNRSITIQPDDADFLQDLFDLQKGNALLNGYKVNLMSHVFVNLNTGKPFVTQSISKAYKRIVDRVGIATQFHDLRHTHATMLLEMNVNPKIVSERLGHSNIGITMNLYSHLMPNTQRDALVGFKGKVPKV